jgi:hypothetical protein
MRREHRHQMTDEERTALYARLDAATELERQMAEDVYVAKRQIVVGSTCYPRGSILPDDVARGLRNFQSLVDSRALMKSPYPSSPSQPYQIKPPVPAKPQPVVELVNHVDPVQAWLLSKQKLVEQGLSPMLAFDALLNLYEGRQLFKQAQASSTAEK